MDIHIVHRSHKIMKSLCILFFLTSLMLSSPFQNVWGITITDGDLDGDTTWTLNQSPYEVTVAINVGSGVTLTVEAGVVVKFVPGNFGIKVKGGGNLAVNGTAENPVYFTDYRDDTAGGDTNGDDTQPVAGSWDGIDVKDEGAANIQYAHIRYAFIGVVKLDAGSFNMSDCTVTHSSEYGIWLYGTSGINTISRCNVSHSNFEGIGLWDVAGNATISGCSLTNNGLEGIIIWDTLGNVILNDCKVSGNTASGIYVSDMMLNMKYSRLLKDLPSVVIYKSNIYGNGEGVKCDGDADPLIGGSGENRNNIYGNASYGVNNHSGDVTITATHNCWGSLSGPYHSSNESGKGNPVSDHVNYDSFVPMSGFDGDLNNNDTVDLADAITAFQVMTGFSPAVFHPEYVVMGIDINGDNRAGLAEAIYIIRNVSGL